MLIRRIIQVASYTRNPGVTSGKISLPYVICLILGLGLYFITLIYYLCAYFETHAISKKLEWV